MSLSDKNAEYMTNAVVGGLLCSLGTTIFILVHNHRLNLSDILWALASFRPKWLAEYFPVLAGIFISTGVLFDALQYGYFNTLQPYGPADKILSRTSMYGFAFSGFALGLGSKLAGGDMIYHSAIGIARLSLKSLIVTVLVLGFSCLWSWLLKAGYIGILSDSQINPQMAFMHLMSANINIAIGVVFLIVSYCQLNGRSENGNLILKKMVGSFIAGVLIALGYCICGISKRSLVFKSFDISFQWAPSILLFLLTMIIVNIVTYHLLLKKIVHGCTGTQHCTLFVNQSGSESLEIKNIFGAILIGSSWGIAGLDLGSYFVQSAIFSVPIGVVFGVFLLLGTMIGDNFDQSNLEAKQTAN